MAPKKQNAATTAAEVGAGLAAVAAAAGATYWFYASDDAKKHRKAAAKWAKDMKTTVVKESKKEWKKAQRLDQKAVTAIVDRAAAMYATARSVDANDLKSAATELKKNWKQVQAEISGAGKKAVSAAKSMRSSAKSAAKKPAKTAKKAAKKPAKKTAAKKRS